MTKYHLLNFQTRIRWENIAGYAETKQLNARTRDTPERVKARADANRTARARRRRQALRAARKAEYRHNGRWIRTLRNQPLRRLWRPSE